jgi:hypothetical protein
LALPRKSEKGHARLAASPKNYGLNRAAATPQGLSAAYAGVPEESAGLLPVRSVTVLARWTIRFSRREWRLNLAQVCVKLIEANP